jgi:hypothetical protein
MHLIVMFAIGLLIIGMVVISAISFKGDVKTLELKTDAILRLNLNDKPR